MNPERFMNRVNHVEPGKGYPYWCWVRTVAFPIAARDCLYLEIEKSCQDFGRPIDQLDQRKASIILAALAKGNQILEKAKTRTEMKELFDSTLDTAKSLSERGKNGIYTLPLSGLNVLSPLISPNIPFNLSLAELLLSSHSRFINLAKGANSVPSFQLASNIQDLFCRFFNCLPPIALRY